MACETSMLVQSDGLGQAAELVAAAHLRRQAFVEWDGAADGDLDLLGRLLADDEVVTAADVGDDRFVDAVAGHADRFADDDAVERDDGGLGAAAADVDDHVAARGADRDARADGGRERLGNEVRGLAGARLLGGVADGALLDARDAGGHGHHHLGPDEVEASR